MHIGSSSAALMSAAIDHIDRSVSRQSSPLPAATTVASPNSAAAVKRQATVAELDAVTESSSGESASRR
jgi:hypothetical protein